MPQCITIGLETFNLISYFISIIQYNFCEFDGSKHDIRCMPFLSYCCQQCIGVVGNDTFIVESVYVYLCVLVKNGDNKCTF